MKLVDQIVVDLLVQRCSILIVIFVMGLTVGGDLGQFFGFLEMLDLEI